VVKFPFFFEAATETQPSPRGQNPAGDLYNATLRAGKNLRTRLVLLLLEQGNHAAASDLDDLEADTGNVTLRVTATTKAGNEDLILKKKRKRGKGKEGWGE
jgi:hypothetical protein